VRQAEINGDKDIVAFVENAPKQQAIQGAGREAQTRTPQFKRWFGDWENAPETASKVVDKNGKPLVVYHGTPNGGFTVFREESYFSPEKKWADIYQNPSASSMGKSGIQNKTNPQTYEVYLDIKKPFDTRNKKERELFQKEFYGKMSGTPLSERTGLPDWTDAPDLAEWIKENNLPYDGLIVDEGGLPQIDGSVAYKGVSYIPFSPTQIKSATGNVGLFDPKNPDIRGFIGAPGSGTNMLTSMAGGGIAGATGGAMIGDTEEERKRNMIIGGALGATAGPIVAGIGAKGARKAVPGLEDMARGLKGEAGQIGAFHGLSNQRGAIGAGAQRITPAELTREIASEPGYVYHATNEERLGEIAESGKLIPHKPNYGTDQDIWPDGGTEKRSYFGRNAGGVWQFAPEEGKPVVIRTKATGDMKTESTGDVFSRKAIPAEQLEYLGKDGNWHPVILK